MRVGRRAALASIAGSGSLLVLEGLALSSGTAERAASIEIVGDDRAYLRLTAPSLSNRGPLDDGGTYQAPHQLEIGNLLTEPIEVSVSSSGGAFTLDGAPSWSVANLDPGTAETVTLAVAGGGTATDTVVVTAHGHTDSVLVEAGRTITLESPTVPELTLSLCRGRSHNCVDLSLSLYPIEEGIGRLEVDGADLLARSNASLATGGVELTGLPATVDLAYDAYGSSAAGNWRVSWLAGQGALATQPGESVTAQLGPYPITIDPSAAGGPQERVSVTVHPD